MLKTPFYDPTKSYQENFEHGPFGEFANSKTIRRQGDPQFKFFGHPVYTPFGIPAGPLPTSAFVGAAFKKGFDICTYKTVKSRFYPVHPKPNILAVKITGDLTLERAKQPILANDQYTEPLSITNSFGVPSMNPDFWQVDMQKAVAAAGKGQVMIGSFEGIRSATQKAEEFVADYVLAARLVKETGAKILEANLGCPNEGTANLVCFDIPRVQQIAERIKNEIGNIPLLLKLGYFASDKELEKLITAVGNIVEGLVVINTIPAPVVNAQGEQALPGEGRKVSGVCGAAIQWAGLEMVRRTKKLRDKQGHSFTIVGVGGILSPTDVDTYLDAGAEVAQSATGAIWHPDLGQAVYKHIQGSK